MILPRWIKPHMYVTLNSMKQILKYLLLLLLIPTLSFSSHYNSISSNVMQVKDGDTVVFRIEDYASEINGTSHFLL
jgi:hypothetical protein